jgi:hypothetical protein
VRAIAWCSRWNERRFFSSKLFAKFYLFFVLPIFFKVKLGWLPKQRILKSPFHCYNVEFPKSRVWLEKLIIFFNKIFYIVFYLHFQVFEATVVLLLFLISYFIWIYSLKYFFGFLTQLVLSFNTKFISLNFQISAIKIRVTLSKYLIIRYWLF